MPVAVNELSQIYTYFVEFADFLIKISDLKTIVRRIHCKIWHKYKPVTQHFAKG